mmetsp:Transcript_52330/g.103930  ORF Transcript_52330/g.103930 Transcript_52330/m.103930 type:complete len:554 (-) Transcript_52330:147-1808(-)|eukprot:CAMPEP_0171690388 /NCGR_PEP_ID=MMETSP0991-20121206/4972_1 /TAXON_ID=483369 /ORGANISM="non described non described, Strain CCMP2098" /LENGTH=553 /DNA_ID=CAMNT_0012278533 /DNA_START=51 /DNA_END=1712 /DNA_ORIENTATION=-
MDHDCPEQPTPRRQPVPPFKARKLLCQSPLVEKKRLLPDILDFSSTVLACDTKKLEVFKQLLVNIAFWGFAIIRVEGDLENGSTAESPISSCEFASRSFFGMPSLSKLRYHSRGKCAEGFVGFHRPSPAKEVLRYRFGLDSRMLRLVNDVDSDARYHTAEESTGGSHSQVDSANAFLRLLDATGRKLHHLSRDLAEGLLEATGSTRRDASALLDEILEVIPPVAQLDTLSDGGIGSVAAHHDNGLELPAPPFDLFFYHNGLQPDTSGTDNKKIINFLNCEAHVDPGLITLIPISSVPGLEVKTPFRRDGKEASGRKERLGRRRQHDSGGPSGCAFVPLSSSGEGSWREEASGLGNNNGEGFVGNESKDSSSGSSSNDGGSSSSEDDQEGLDGRVSGRWVSVEQEVCTLLSTQSIELSENTQSILELEKQNRVLLVVLAGEFLETLSAGIIPAGLHRVVSPPPLGEINDISTAHMNGSTTAAGAEVHIKGLASNTSAVSNGMPRARFSLVFDLQPSSAAKELVGTVEEKAREIWSRREAQPPLNVIQRAAGRCY